MKAAIYARVSTVDQEPENQLQELRRYVEARDWSGVEYVDHGVSGATERRPALDRLLADARRRRFDVLVCWRLDRLGRNLKHLITLLDDLQALGVAFVSLAEGIDATTPARKLQMHILGAIAEFERERIRERVLAGLQRARTQGKRRRSDRTAPARRWAGGGCRRGAARCLPVDPQALAPASSTILFRLASTFAPDRRCSSAVDPGSSKQVFLAHDLSRLPYSAACAKSWRGSGSGFVNLSGCQCQVSATRVPTARRLALAGVVRRASTPSRERIEGLAEAADQYAFLF
jgi:hypothetical protein